MTEELARMLKPGDVVRNQLSLRTITVERKGYAGVFYGDPFRYMECFLTWGDLEHYDLVSGEGVPPR